MRFKVRRTSVWDEDVQPCPEASRGEIDRWDVRTFKSPEEHDAKLPGRPWHSQGTEHQIIRGPRGGSQGIKRNTGKVTAWYVELDDLAALMAFWERHGDLVLTTATEDGETPQLEIYDGWRE